MLSLERKAWYLKTYSLSFKLRSPSEFKPPQRKKKSVYSLLYKRILILKFINILNTNDVIIKNKHVRFFSTKPKQRKMTNLELKGIFYPMYFKDFEPTGYN